MADCTSGAIEAALLGNHITPNVTKCLWHRRRSWPPAKGHLRMEKLKMPKLKANTQNDQADPFGQFRLLSINQVRKLTTLSANSCTLCRERVCSRSLFRSAPPGSPFWNRRCWTGCANGSASGPRPRSGRRRVRTRPPPQRNPEKQKTRRRGDSGFE